MATISCKADADCFGTRNADTLRGTDGYDYIFGRKGNDVIRSRGNTDNLYGQGGNDRLFAGSGSEDKLTGGPGNDALDGGADDDNYLFGPGWGKDTLVDDATSGNLLSFQDFSGQSASVTEDLIIRFTSGDGPDVKNLDATNTIDWEGEAPIEWVYSGDGDDEITGNALFGFFRACTITGTNSDDVLVGTVGNDVICGLEGSDVIRSREGDDTIFGDGGGDTLIGGKGRDAHFGGLASDRLDGRDGGPSDSMNGQLGLDNCLADQGDALVSCP